MDFIQSGAFRSKSKSSFKDLEALKAQTLRFSVNTLSSKAPAKRMLPSISQKGFST